MTTAATRALPEDARQEARFAAAESAGLFVGVQVCEEPQLSPVDFAVDDAVDLAEVFVFDLGLVPPENAVLALAGEPRKEGSRRGLERLLAAGATREAATAAAIYRLLPRMALRSGRQGLLVFSFAGHGFCDAGGDLLVTRDFVARQPAATGLRFATLMDEMRLSAAPRRLVFLDACRVRLRSQRGADDLAETPSFEQAILQSKGAAIIASTVAGGTAFDDPERGNGVFTGTLVDLLRGNLPVPGPGPYLTVGGLASAVDDKVRGWIALNRQEHAGKSLGISSTFDPDSMRQLPLAADPKQLEVHRDFRLRCSQALTKLRIELEPPLTGALFDDLGKQLAAASAEPGWLRVVEAIERLDGSRLARETLLAIYEKRQRDLASPAARAASPIRPTTRPFRIATLSLMLLGIAAVLAAWHFWGPGLEKNPDAPTGELICSTKKESFDQSMPTHWKELIGDYGFKDGSFWMTASLPGIIHKRCFDCQVRAVSYRLSASLRALPKPGSGWGLFLLDQNPARDEMVVAEVYSGNAMGLFRSWAGGQQNLGTTYLGAEGKLRLTVEAKDGVLKAWANDALLVTSAYDAKSLGDQPLGAGFYVRAAAEVPVEAYFDDYEFTSCVRSQ